MKILLVHNYYRYRGGEDVYVDSLKELLIKNGHEVFVYSKNSQDIKTLMDKISCAQNMFLNSKTSSELTKIIKEFKPDIAQFQNVNPLITPTAYRVCKKLNVPIVQRISNYRFICPKGTLFRSGKICEECVGKSFFYPSIFHGCYDKSKAASFAFSSSYFFHKMIGSFDFIDMFLFPTKFIRDYYVKNLGLNIKKNSIVPTFVNPNYTHKTVKKKRGDYFLYVGRLSEEKGVLQLLEVFSRLPKLKLVVIGDGPLRKDVVKFINNKNIRYLGYQKRNKIFQYMTNANATIIPSSWYDVLPNVMLESLSQNTPVIIPDKKSYSHIIPQNKGSVFVYSEDCLNELINIIQNIQNEVKFQKDSDPLLPSLFFYKRQCQNIISLYKNIISNYER